MEVIKCFDSLLHKIFLDRSDEPFCASIRGRETSSEARLGSLGYDFDTFGWMAVEPWFAQVALRQGLAKRINVRIALYQSPFQASFAI